MEPRVRYAKTKDGVNIAYASVGEGRTLLFPNVAGMGNALTSIAFPPASELIQQLRVVRYDPRGSGLSARGTTDFSLDAMVHDLNAVADAVGDRRLALLATADMTPVVIKFAADHPARVTHLVLFDAFATSRDYKSAPFYDFDRQLIGQDWELFTETFVRVNMRLEGTVARLVAESIRANIQPETWHAYAAAAAENWEVHEQLPSVRAQTLVVDNRAGYLNAGKRIAAAIPNAEFTMIDDPVYLQTADLISRFVCGGRDEPISASDITAGMTAILFTDIADSTALTEQLGDAAFRKRARTLDRSLRTTIRRHSGTPIEGKLLGDGVLAVFGAARDAIACALACHAAADALDLKLHVGVHAGDVIKEDGNVFGGAVNIAARVASEAASGQTLVSGTVRDLARTSAGVSFDDLGQRKLKGIGEPVRLFTVTEGD